MPKDLGEGDIPRAEIERPSDLPRLTEVLVARGWSEDDIRKILGGNVLRVLRDVMGVPTT